MSDKITTLHPEDDSTVNLYPNIKADNIPSSAVTEDKLADDAVSSDKIADSAITSSKLDSDLNADATWVEAIKDHVVQNSNTTEVGGNLEVDGTLTVNSESVASDLTVDGALGVTGNAVVNGTVTVGKTSANKDLTVNGNLEVSGHEELQGALGVHGNTVIGTTDANANLTVNGNVAIPTLSNLVDSSGTQLVGFNITAVTETTDEIDITVASV